VQVPRLAWIEAVLFQDYLADRTIPLGIPSLIAKDTQRVSFSSSSNKQYGHSFHSIPLVAYAAADVFANTEYDDQYSQKISDRGRYL